MEFTGERMTTGIEGEIEFEHFHRYCLARDLCPGLDVLDVASGEGYGSSILATVARSVTGVDVDPGSIAHARTTYAWENLRFIEGSALDLPVDDASVDAIVSFETLEHVREHARFMAEVKRVLRSDGRFIISTPERAVYSARGGPLNKYHLLELTVVELDALLRANFRNVLILNQRSVLGSLILAAEGGGSWRSYERRSREHIEASSGLARTPYLIGLASDAALPPVYSSAYFDRRSVYEVVRDFARAPGLEARAVECEHQRDMARAALADAELQTTYRESERDMARTALAEAEVRAAQHWSEREALQIAAETRIAELKAERDEAAGIQTLLQSQVSRLREHSENLAW